MHVEGINRQMRWQWHFIAISLHFFLLFLIRSPQRGHDLFANEIIFFCRNWQDLELFIWDIKYLVRNFDGTCVAVRNKEKMQPATHHHYNASYINHPTERLKKEEHHLGRKNCNRFSFVFFYSRNFCLHRIKHFSSDNSKWTDFYIAL